MGSASHGLEPTKLYQINSFVIDLPHISIKVLYNQLTGHRRLAGPKNVRNEIPLRFGVHTFKSGEHYFKLFPTLPE